MKIKTAKKYLGLTNVVSKKDKTESDLATEIGTMVTELRIIKGITQAELAKRLNTKQPSIARLENGSDLPSLKFLFKIAKSLGTYLIPPKFGLIKNAVSDIAAYSITVHSGKNKQHAKTK